MSTKTCTRCCEAKPLAEFYKHPQTADRLAPHCKACDNKRSRKATGARINRTRARHRAVADLINFHLDEFQALLEIRLHEAQEEAEALASEPAAEEHYRAEPVRLKPGKKMAGQTVRDRIDVARCPHCVKHHDRGHACPSCGASPLAQKVAAAPRPAHSGIRRPLSLDVEALDAFNRGTSRARAANR